MTGIKQLQIGLLLLFIFSFSIFTIILDFSRFWGNYMLYNAYPVEYLKRVIVLLAAALVWLSGKSCLSPQDIRHMKYVFVAICCGEAGFLLAKPGAAIGFFAICQCLLISRHSKGLIKKLITANSAQKLKLALSAFMLITFLSTGIYALYPLASANSPLKIAWLYAFILSISLWAGLANYILGLFPHKNSKMIAIGMLCFFCCDVLVGLDGLLKTGAAWLLASGFIWVFYTPAITLLALSCYSYSIPDNKNFNPFDKVS